MNTLFALIVALLMLSMSRYLMACILKYNGWGQVKKDYAYQPTVSVLMPCYNEGKTVYETIASISQSDYPREKFEVIAVDDCSKDDSHAWMLKAQADFPHVNVLSNEHNSGKADTVLNALRHSAAEIVITIDSDCTFAANTMQELVACLADPTLGAVGGRVGVKNVNTNVLTRAQTFSYYVTFHILKTVESWTKTVACISGCLFAVRRELYLNAETNIRRRNWLGVHVNEGEDRYLTHQILLQGYGTYINGKAECWTTVPATFGQLFRQQLRWRRGALRDFFMTMRSLPLHFKTMHINGVMAMTLTPITLLSSVVLLLAAPFYSPLFWVLPIGLVLHGAAEAVLSLFINKYSPEQRVTVPGCLVAASVWTYVNCLLTILSLCTLGSSAWGTRELKGEKHV
jgi:cellulose synthase/poly-beta-1,6-N-acetylglucosamine synthase-like glycosyltransferase